MKSVNKILFVCLGNICRSPLAEGICRAKAQAMGLQLTFDSCGTGGWHAGEPPDLRAQQCATRHGLSITDLRARKFVTADFDAFDLIYAMDMHNYSDLVRLAKTPAHKAKIRLLLNEVYPNENMPVPDPFYGRESDFEHAFDLLEQAAEVVLSNIKNR